MTNRRQFLQGAAGASAAPVAAKAAWAERSADAGRNAFGAVVVDARFEPAQAFGARMAEHGAPLRQIEADVTPLWSGELRARWAERPEAIAGLTAPPALFCLEQLAWERGMRVMFHVEHRINDAGVTEHAILRSAIPLAASDLSEAGPRWVEVLARTVSTHRDDTSAVSGPTGAGLRSSISELPDDSLVSWIIAPRGKA